MTMKTTQKKITLKHVRSRAEGPIQTEEYFYEVEGTLENLPEDESIKALHSKRSDAWYNFANENTNMPVRISVTGNSIRIEHYSSHGATVRNTKLFGPRDYTLQTGGASIVAGAYTHGVEGESNNSGGGEILSRLFYD